MTKTPVRAVLAALLFSCAAPLWAGPSSDALQTCFADNTSARDRKDLARWIFLAVAMHPDIRSLSVATGNDRLQSNQTVGKLYTRLLTESCASEVKALVRTEGQGALSTAFESLGRLAMQELMTNREVAGSIDQLVQHIDQIRVAGMISSAAQQGRSK